MADPARDFTLDPMAMWRDAVAQWEKGINEVAGQTLGTKEFAQGMHGAMGTSLSAQKAFADMAGRYLTALNLPSRVEVAALGERLSQIESRLIRMNTMLEHLVDPVAAGLAGTAFARVPRTRRPPPREPSPPPEALPAPKTARQPARKVARTKGAKR